MSGSNAVIVAAAGSGKTTFLVREALSIKSARVLITTYTESNEIEIRQKFYEINGHIPANVVIMTWFSFLITHGVKPFQTPLFDFRIRGMELVQSASGVKYKTKAGWTIYWGEEENFIKHYFNGMHHVYSDKLSKLVLRCDDASNGHVFDRIQRIFPHIFIDEVQDLAGHDLDLLVKFFRSTSSVLLVGDPRQVTYLTHHERHHVSYANGGIVQFLKSKLPQRIKWQLDDKSLSLSHRNSKMICEISSKLYPSMTPSQPCSCNTCRRPELIASGLFVVKRKDVDTYLQSYPAIQLRDDVTVKGINNHFPAMNFGVSKGRGFDRVLIFPNQPMLAWFRDPEAELKPQTRAKLYVALTRARHSVAVVSDDPATAFHSGFIQYLPDS